MQAKTASVKSRAVGSDQAEITPIGYFNAMNSADVVNARMEACSDARLKAVIGSIVSHFHAVVKETKPTIEEWEAAIQFLTKTGQACNEWRQEYILLSDVLGVSMLVDALNHDKDSRTTESTVLGPFHVDNAPARMMGEDICLDGIGQPILVRGRVLNEQGKPIDGATLDVWQANGDGFYDVQQSGIQPHMNLRGLFRTGSDGRFWFRTIEPRHYSIPADGPVGQLLHALGRHPNRPAHIHFIVGADKFNEVTTHLFVKGDPYLESDAVFGVKQSLIAEMQQVDDPGTANFYGLANPFSVIEWDFCLRSQATANSRRD